MKICHTAWSIASTLERCTEVCLHKSEVGKKGLQLISAYFVYTQANCSFYLKSCIVEFRIAVAFFSFRAIQLHDNGVLLKYQKKTFEY